MTHDVADSTVRNVRSITSESAIYYGLFDPLRAVLALAVFLSHADILPDFIAGAGGFAVRVFFALSGFLVGGILLQSAQNSGFWRDTPRFYFNRCVRIWIPYYLMIGAYVVLMLLRGFWSDELGLRLIPMLTYTHNWANDVLGLSESVTPINHAWSLAVEEQFYLLCPLIIGVVRSRRLVIAAMLALALVLPLAFEIDYYSAICLGVAAAAAHQTMSRTTWFYLQRICLALSLPAFLIVMNTELQTDPIAVAGCSVLIVIGFSANVPKTPLMYLLGAMSYSFYLFHWLGLYIATPIAKRFGESHYLSVKAVVALVIAVAISYASVKLVEWPLIQRRGLIARRYPALVPISATVALSLTILGGLWLWI